MRVSIVMASCNPDVDLMRKSINSVINQSYTDFEFIIVDDGSSHAIEPCVRNISDDSRIQVYRIDNSGLGAALNYGISKAQGEYIARLDDDDIMVETRIGEQVKYLDAHTDVSCVGTWHFDRYENKYFPHRKFPLEHDEIVKSLLSFRFALAHTTLMFRKGAFEKIGGYRIQRGGQDLDLLLQLGTVGKLANVPMFLNYYTMSANGLGTINPQKYKAYLFALKNVSERNLYPEYRHITLNSIKKLQTIDKGPLKSVLEKTKRYLFILRICMLGKMMR